MKLSSPTRLPTTGWIIEGEFLEVDEGGRLRRAMIGFGSGAAKMEIEAVVSELTQNQKIPFLVFDSGTSSRKGPGAAFIRNPYVTAAKLILSKNSSKKDIQKLAKRIADSICDYMKEKNLLK